MHYTAGSQKKHVNLCVADACNKQLTRLVTLSTSMPVHITVSKASSRTCSLAQAGAS